MGWPNADGLVHASIFTSREPPGITLAEAELHARQGLEIIRRAQAADRRLTDLFATYGVIYAYVHDYGHGAVNVGEISRDGSVTLI